VGVKAGDFLYGAARQLWGVRGVNRAAVFLLTARLWAECVSPSCVYVYTRFL
jgi:hypothetical protein